MPEVSGTFSASVKRTETTRHARGEIRMRPYGREDIDDAGKTWRTQTL